MKDYPNHVKCPYYSKELYESTTVLRTGDDSMEWRKNLVDIDEQNPTEMLKRTCREKGIRKNPITNESVCDFKLEFERNLELWDEVSML